MARRMNPTAAALLGLLEDCGELTGGQLVRVADQRIGDYWSLTRSQVYRELATLAAQGDVVAGDPGPREAQPYRISATGRQRLRAWLAEEQPAETVRNNLLLIVAFGRHLPPGRLARILDDRERRCRQRLARYASLDAELVSAGVDAHVRATLSFGLHYERAVLSWLAGLPSEVRGHSPVPEPNSRNHEPHETHED